jgi:CheY-like chemotaxis protein
MREGLAVLLRLAGYDVVEAASGIEAWEHFQKGRFSLVLSDW